MIYLKRNSEPTNLTSTEKVPGSLDPKPPMENTDDGLRILARLIAPDLIAIQLFEETENKLLKNQNKIIT